MSSKVTAQLILVEGDPDEYSSMIKLKERNISIGRGSKADIVWDSPQISRKHATLEFYNQRWFLRDTARSTHGVYVNGTKLEKGNLRLLNGGDLIGVHLTTGNVTYRFTYFVPATSSPKKFSPKPSTSKSVMVAPSTNADVTVELSSDYVTSDDESLEPNKPRGSKRKRKAGLTSKKGMSKKKRLDEVSGPEDLVPSISSDFTVPQNGFMNEEQISNCKDLAVLRTQLTESMMKMKIAEVNLEKLKFEQIMEQEEYQIRAAADAKEAVERKILELLESEISCVICNEIFIQATAVECGHVFCDLCINEWATTKQNCPICRAVFQKRSRLPQMENFISKLFELFSKELREERMVLLNERAKEDI